MAPPSDMSNLSIEERSNVEERKLTILKDYNQYMEDHPELRQALNDFACAVLTDKPKNIYKFARYWFSMSLPPLDPLSTAATMPKASEPEEQTIEMVKTVATHRLLARVYSTIDCNADERCSKKEFETSVLYGVWPEAVWARMDVNNDGFVTPIEFFDFMRTVEADEGKSKFHDSVANNVWEAGIDVQDLMPPVEGLKERVKAVDEAKLRDYLFKSAIHLTSGEPDRQHITKRELQYSRIGQEILPFWSRLDADADNKITQKEWNRFFEQAMELDLGKELAASGDSLVVDLFIHAGYDINDVE